MKYTILIVVLLIFAKAAFTQLVRPEYSRYTNGILYEDTMLRMHYLFLNYLHFINDKDLLAMFQKLKDADKKLPHYMHSALKASMKGPLELIEPD